MRTTSILARSAVVAAAALVLAGCATPAQEQQRSEAPTEIETPEIVWEAGPPQGEFESDPAVVAARAANLGMALARNAHDFTIDQLTDYVDSDYIEWMYENDLKEVKAGSPELYPGPVPLSVTEVVDNGETTDVVFCALTSDWIISADHPEASVDLGNASELTFSMRPDDDGTFVLVDVAVALKECDASQAAVGRFSPAPVLPESVPVDSVRPPTGYQE